AWRMLNRLKNETWAADAIDMMYLDEDLLQWAQATNDHLESDGNDMHRDCNGAILLAGDSVTLIKSLDVKGSSVQAKIGTAVRNIKLVHDNTEQIEGKIDGQQIVILTKYVKKS
ncbi:MAG: alkylphosphonate utilization protein, partial [Bacteroidota bacterium]